VPPSPRQHGREEDDEEKLYGFRCSTLREVLVIVPTPLALVLVAASEIQKDDGGAV
jgi:hypothetical protein